MKYYKYQLDEFYVDLYKVDNDKIIEAIGFRSDKIEIQKVSIPAKRLSSTFLCSEEEYESFKKV